LTLNNGRSWAGTARTISFFFLVLILAAVGCGSKDIYLAGQTRVAVALYDGAMAGDPYYENCAQGFERLRGQNIDPQYFENPTGKPFADILAAAVASRPDVIWCLDSRGADAAAEAAAANPEIQFITLEHAYAEPASNLAGVYFDSPGASFLAGYLAAVATENGDVGIAGGAASAAPEEFAFKAGVIYAGNSLGKSIRVHSAFAGDNYDAAAAEGAAATLYGEGCDVIFSSSGHTAAAAVTAAQNAGRSLICLNYGQYTADAAPDGVVAFVAESVDARADGMTKMAAAGQVGGQNHFFGFPTNSVRLERVGTSFSDQEWEAMNNVLSRILAGDFRAPADQEALDEFVAAAPWRSAGG
jgi:basic membrane protein A